MVGAVVVAAAAVVVGAAGASMGDAACPAAAGTALIAHQAKSEVEISRLGRARIVARVGE